MSPDTSAEQPNEDIAAGAAPAGESARTARRTAWLLALFALLHGLVFQFALPPWMGEDEPWHFENVTHVSNGHLALGGEEFGPDDTIWAPLSQLQVMRRFSGLDRYETAALQERVLESMREHDFWRRVDWVGRDDDVDSFDLIAHGFTTAHQPPLYYYLTGTIVALFGGGDLELGLIVARLFSLVLFAATVFVTYHVARELLGEKEQWLVLLATFVVAWFPMHARMAAVVSNDVLARFVGTVALLLAARHVSGRGRPREVVLLLVVCAIGILTKTTTMSCVGVAGLAVLLRQGGEYQKTRKALLLIGGIAVLAAFALLFWVDMHNPAIPNRLKNFRMRMEYGLSLQALIDIRDSLLGTFNWEARQQPHWIRAVFGAALVAAIVGVLVRLRQNLTSIERRLILLASGAIAFQLALNILRGVGKGRYMMPAVAAFGVLLVLGWIGPLPERARRVAGLALVLVLVVYDTWFLWGGLATNHYLVWGY